MNDLDCLTYRYIDGIASEAEVATLNELLRFDAQARLLFAMHLNIDSALAEVAAGLPGKQAALDDIVELNQRAIFSNAVAYSIATATVAVALTLGAWMWLASPQPIDLANDPTLSPPVLTEEPSSGGAVLIDQAGAEFAAERAPRDGNFSPGNYELLAGMAHLRFALGADLILNGPARWTILDSMHVRIEYGKLRAIVPPSAKGFSIETPDAEYIDLGTEFGLNVDQRGRASDLYVFDGQVNVADKASKQVIEEVLEGGSKRYRQGAGEPAPKKNSTDFPTPNQIGLVRWQRHAEQLLKDPGLIAFFPFRKMENESLLKNERNDMRGIPDGRIVGPRWVSGRWPGKDSLLFDGDNEFVELNIPGEFHETTVAAWIKIDRLDYEMNAILNSDELRDGGVHFQLTRQGLPKGGVQAAAFGGGITNDTFIGDPLPIGNWVHVAMVISSSERIRSIYANGKLVRRGVMKHEATIRPSSCRLGNWLPFDGHKEKRMRALRGRIDELALWNRALLQSEIHELVEAGRPNALSE